MFDGTLSAFLNIAQFAFEFRHALVDQTAVGFQLLFTRPTSGSDTTLDAFQVSPHAFQSRAEIQQLREFHLQHRFVCSRVCGEDVEDDFAAIDDNRLHSFFEVLPLCGSEIVVENDEVGVGRLDHHFKLFNFTAAKTGGRMGMLSELNNFADNGHSSGLGETFEFVKNLVFGKRAGIGHHGSQYSSPFLNTQFFSFWVAQGCS